MFCLQKDPRWIRFVATQNLKISFPSTLFYGPFFKRMHFILSSVILNNLAFPRKKCRVNSLNTRNVEDDVLSQTLRVVIPPAVIPIGKHFQHRVAIHDLLNYMHWCRTWSLGTFGHLSILVSVLVSVLPLRHLEAPTCCRLYFAEDGPRPLPMWCHSITAPTVPVTMDKEYYHMPYREKKPCLYMRCQYEDHRPRMFIPNIIEKLCRKLVSLAFQAELKIQ